MARVESAGAAGEGRSGSVESALSCVVMLLAVVIIIVVMVMHNGDGSCVNGNGNMLEMVFAQ